MLEKILGFLVALALGAGPPCSACKGSAKVGMKPCPTCLGTGSTVHALHGMRAGFLAGALWIRPQK